MLIRLSPRSEGSCFIRSTSSPFRKDARLKLLTQEVDEAVVQAHHLQVDKADFLQLVEARFDAFHDRRTRAASE